MSPVTSAPVVAASWRARLARWNACLLPFSESTSAAPLRPKAKARMAATHLSRTIWPKRGACQSNITVRRGAEARRRSNVSLISPVWNGISGATATLPTLAARICQLYHKGQRGQAVHEDLAPSEAGARAIAEAALCIDETDTAKPPPLFESLLGKST